MTEQAGTLSHCTANPISQTEFQVLGYWSVRAKIYRDSILPPHPFLHLPQVRAVQVKALPPAQAGGITEELWLSIFSLRTSHKAECWALTFKQ